MAVRAANKDQRAMASWHHQRTSRGERDGIGHELTTPRTQRSRSDSDALKVPHTSTQSPRTNSASLEGTRTRINLPRGDDVGIQETRTSNQSGGLEVSRTSNQSPPSGSSGDEVQNRSKRRHIETNQLLKEEPILEHPQRNKDEEN